MEILKKTIVKDIIINVIYLILIVIYLVCFNIQGTLLAVETLTQFINISSMVFLVISIIMLEVGYRKENTKIFINGIEFFILAIFTLLIKHMPKVLENTMKSYVEVGLYASIAYYILKLAIIFTKDKHEQLKNLSDIKEIVKEEPTKKITKRKNIKVEEGK